MLSTGAAQVQAITSFKSMKFSKAGKGVGEVFAFLVSLVLSRPLKSVHLKERKKVKSLSCVRLFANLWTVAYQAPPSMGFSRQEYWSQFPFPSPGNLPDPGIKPRFPVLKADALSSEPPGNILQIAQLGSFQLQRLLCGYFL